MHRRAASAFVLGGRFLVGSGAQGSGGGGRSGSGPQGGDDFGAEDAVAPPSVLGENRTGPSSAGAVPLSQPPPLSTPPPLSPLFQASSYPPAAEAAAAAGATLPLPFRIVSAQVGGHVLVAGGNVGACGGEGPGRGELCGHVGEGGRAVNGGVIAPFSLRLARPPRRGESGLPALSAFYTI